MAGAETAGAQAAADRSGEADLVDTHKGFVERWECDTNDHLNVRFYAKRFDEALDMLAALQGAAPVRVTCRHVRFHREMRADILTRVRSARVAGGPADGRIVHLLENAETGAVAAAALDDVAAKDGAGGGAALAATPRVAADIVAAAMPRSIGLAPAAPEDALARLARGAATVSNVRVADPRSFDASGSYRAFEYISGFSDGAAHAWSFAGLTNAVLAEKNWGRVAVESKVTVFNPPQPGAVLRQISWVAAVAEKTLQIVHQVDDARTGTIVARGDFIGLILDFATRRAAPMPEFVIAPA